MIQIVGKLSIRVYVKMLLIGRRTITRGDIKYL
jgi:hypothetical protein